MDDIQSRELLASRSAQSTRWPEAHGLPSPNHRVPENNRPLHPRYRDGDQGGGEEPGQSDGHQPIQAPGTITSKG